MARRKEPKIPDATLDQLLAGADPKTAEMDHHLASGEAGNSRNSYGKKTVTTKTSRIELDIPRNQATSSSSTR